MACPFCGHEAPVGLFGWLAKPPGPYVQAFRCPACRKILAPAEHEGRRD